MEKLQAGPLSPRLAAGARTPARYEPIFEKASEPNGVYELIALSVSGVVADEHMELGMPGSGVFRSRSYEKSSRKVPPGTRQAYQAEHVEEFRIRAAAAEAAAAQAELRALKAEKAAEGAEARGRKAEERAAAAQNAQLACEGRSQRLLAMGKAELKELNERLHEAQASAAAQAVHASKSEAAASRANELQEELRMVLAQVDALQKRAEVAEMRASEAEKAVARLQSAEDRAIKAEKARAGAEALASATQDVLLASMARAAAAEERAGLAEKAAAAAAARAQAAETRIQTTDTALSIQSFQDFDGGQDSEAESDEEPHVEPASKTSTSSHSEGMLVQNPLLWQFPALRQHLVQTSKAREQAMEGQ